MGSTPPEIVRDQAFITRRDSLDISSGKKFNDLARWKVLEPSTPELFNPHLVGSFDRQVPRKPRPKGREASFLSSFIPRNDTYSYHKSMAKTMG